VWDSARFTGIFLASGFFYTSSIVHARPHAGNANRWAFPCKISVQKKMKKSFRDKFGIAIGEVYALFTL
jgi:hypothetical protein